MARLSVRRPLRRHCETSVLSALSLVIAAVSPAGVGAADPVPGTTPPTATQPSLPGAGVPPEAEAGVISDQTLADLDHDSFEVREQAARRLTADDSLTLQTIAQAYAKARTPEQRHALLVVARHHFVRTVREQLFTAPVAGSLGVAIQGVPAAELPDLKQPAVRVMSTIPGFPSYTALRAGDLILTVDGQGLADGADLQVRTQLRQLVMNGKAGQTVKLEVFRDGKTIPVAVKLASMAALMTIYEQQGNPDHPQQLAPPFGAVWDKFQEALERTKPGDPPIAVDLSGLKALAQQAEQAALATPDDPFK